MTQSESLKNDANIYFDKRSLFWHHQRWANSDWLKIRHYFRLNIGSLKSKKWSEHLLYIEQEHTNGTFYKFNWIECLKSQILIIRLALKWWNNSEFFSSQNWLKALKSHWFPDYRCWLPLPKMLWQQYSSQLLTICGAATKLENFPIRTEISEKLRWTTQKQNP